MISGFVRTACAPRTDEMVDWGKVLHPDKPLSLKIND
jgi:hypothetical protein